MHADALRGAAQHKKFADKSVQQRQATEESTATRKNVA